MSNDGKSRSNRHLHTWVRVAALLALVALIVVERYYKSHPQLLEHQLGNSGFALLMLGMGCFLVWQAVMGVRNGAITGTYTPSQWKRSENAPMFWFLVVTDGAFGVLVLVGGFGLMFGLLQ
ncbi:hypothetical protein [Rhodanobacter glycinis]|uniref:hypothetical protein n=1 Tax=Rhodanobacter glycinis TaxID=582702 RepID=UPI0011142F47|nr:hypothetical protein [Rhodanobacter glycinis]